MNLSDLLSKHDIDSKTVIVLRHRPHEPALNKVLPWLAAERPSVFNAYQQTQGPRLEGAMQKLVGSGFIASFIGHEPGKALFVGLYSIEASKPLTYTEYWQVPAYAEMKEKFGMRGWSREKDDRAMILWFDLERKDFYTSWQGKLVVSWPGLERAWWRRAHRNEFPVSAVREESVLSEAMPHWTKLDFTSAELGVLPSRWRAALSQWRGIYLIYDESDGKSYVGSAYGENNILGRWLNYAARGHGGNALLRERDPANFHFTILQRVSPDMEATEILKIEASWKHRLHTLAPNGLNKN